MATLRDESRAGWTGSGTIETIQAGALQRIADAVEVMAKSNADLIAESVRQEAIAANRQARIELLERRIRGLRGYIKRIKAGL